MAVHARTLEFYRQLGIADAVVDAAVRFEAVNLWVRGKRAAHVDLGPLAEREGGAWKVGPAVTIPLRHGAASCADAGRMSPARVSDSSEVGWTTTNSSSGVSSSVQFVASVLGMYWRRSSPSGSRSARSR